MKRALISLVTCAVSVGAISQTGLLNAMTGDVHQTAALEQSAAPKRIVIDLQQPKRGSAQQQPFVSADRVIKPMPAVAQGEKNALVIEDIR